MLNKKIAMSALSIVTVVALVGGATFALFTDQATANDSTFASGNADLQLAVGTIGPSNVPATFTDTIPAPDFENLAPGFTGNTGFWLRNNSSSSISLDLTADIADLQETAPVGQSLDLKDALLIKWNCDLNNDGTLESSTAEFSVNAWFTGGKATLGELDADEEVYCQMEARVPATAGNEIQGDTVTFDAVYDGTQTVEAE